METIEEEDEGVIFCETSSEVGKGRRMSGFRRERVGELKSLGKIGSVGWLGMSIGGMSEKERKEWKIRVRQERRVWWTDGVDKAEKAERELGGGGIVEEFFAGW